LIASLVDFSLVINLLNNVELDFHGRLLRATSIATNLALVFIIIIRVGGIGIRELNMGNLKVVLSITGSVSADEQAMSGIGLVGNTIRERPFRNL
jgi:hypothetical protein